MKEPSKSSRNSMASLGSEIRDDMSGPTKRSLWRAVVYSIGGLLGAIALFKMVSYKSVEPWIFGRYSLPYFVFLIVSISVPLYLGFLFYRFRFKALYFVLGLLIFFALIIAVIEAGGQIYAFIYPSYRLLSLEPDRIVGWKLVPNLQFTWAGHHWYAREFSVPIRTNSLGFRDIERALAKPQGVIRVALLGDSMVEALQVPFEKTAAQALEKKLTYGAGSENAKHAKYEVINFGVSNYGVGQYLLAWEQYASKFNPDYVFIFVGEIHIDRTITKYEPGAVSSTPKRLWLRPTFRVENNELVREPAMDFDEFVKAQKELIDNEFGGKRIARRSHGLFIAPLMQFSLWHRLMEIQRSATAQARTSEKRSIAEFHPVNPEMIDVNLRVIAELGREVKNAGGQLVVVDASNIFPYLRWQTLPATLEKFCAERGFGWIPLGRELMAVENQGVVTRWPYDQHFNVAGNELFADAMYRWITERSGSQQASNGSPTSLSRYAQ